MALSFWNLSINGSPNRICSLKKKPKTKKQTKKNTHTIESIFCSVIWMQKQFKTHRQTHKRSLSYLFKLTNVFIFKQIRSWIVKNGRCRGPYPICVWVLSVRWRRANRLWSTATSPAPTCRKSRQKVAVSKKRSPSTASLTYSWFATKADHLNSK